MNSGNRWISSFCLLAASLLAAAQARAPGTANLGGILVARDLPGAQSTPLQVDCPQETSVRRVELRFEKLTADPDPEVLRDLMTHGAQSRVDFDFNPATGELTYHGRTELMSPADRAPVPPGFATTSCESR